QDAEYCPCPNRSDGGLGAQGPNAQGSYGRDEAPPAAAAAGPAGGAAAGGSGGGYVEGPTTGGSAAAPPQPQASAGYQQGSRRFAAYSKVAHAAALRRRHL
ncbi:hypothetical protein AAVH_30742, partial [Aphelenchoides avenae]